MSLKRFIKTQVLSSYNKERIVFLIGVVSIFFSSIISVFAANYLYSSSEVSFDNSSSGISSDNVQGAIDELYQNASDYSSLESRIGVLEGHWKNGATSYFDAEDGYEWLRIVNSTTGKNRGISIHDSNDTKRGLLYFQPGDETVRLDARNSAGTAGQGKLNLLGNPVMVNGKEIGEFAGVNPDAVNLANATDKSVGSITLSAGTWFVYFNVRFATNATGRRYAALFTDSSCSSGTGILGSNAVNAVNGGQTFVNAQQILNHSASRTYYVCAYQNSGSTLSTTARIQAIRIDY